MTYFDAVLDERMRPVFNGTPEETVEWLSNVEAPWDDAYKVCRGRDMRLLEIGEYLKEAKFRRVLELVREVIDEELSASLRVFEIAHDISMLIIRELGGKPEFREKYFEIDAQVYKLLGEAIEVKDPNAHACEIAWKIVELGGASG